MPTKKDILCFPADTDLLKRIDDFRYENRIPSRSEAMRRLIEEGLKFATKRKAGKGRLKLSD
jgi:metal-responsive CopG/Arc/MetJ family transcriptional regulator